MNMKNQSSDFNSSQVLADKLIDYDFRADLTRPKDKTHEDFLSDLGIPSIKTKVHKMVNEKVRSVYGNPLPEIVK